MLLRGMTAAVSRKRPLLSCESSVWPIPREKAPRRAFGRSGDVPPWDEFGGPIAAPLGSARRMSRQRGTYGRDLFPRSEFLPDVKSACKEFGSSGAPVRASQAEAWQGARGTRPIGLGGTVMSGQSRHKGRVAARDASTQSSDGTARRWRVGTLLLGTTHTAPARRSRTC